MVVVSKLLFFISHHGFYTTVLLFLIFGVLSWLTKKIGLFWWAIPLAIVNGFAGQYLNAWFLNKCGVESTAIITSDVETNSTLNERYIHDYEAIVKKQDGTYVNTYFSTTTASIYPIANAIRIPSTDQPIPVKYIPGYEKNIVILYNQSEEGKILRHYEKLSPVNAAKTKYEADRTNKDFIKEYISALEDYLNSYDDPVFSARLEALRKELKRAKG